MEYTVAKTYTDYPRLSEPFQKGDKWYVSVRLKNGNAKDVRAYPVEPPAADRWNAKKGLGFLATGYITIFKGEISMEDPYFNKNKDARYHRVWGWYLADGAPVPEDLPSYAIPKLLYWNDVGNEDNTLKDEKAMRQAVNKLIF